MTIKKYFSQIKNKINSISFDVVILYMLIGAVAFYTTNKVNKIHNFAPLYKIHSKILLFNNTYNLFLLHDVNSENFVKTGTSNYIKKANKQYKEVLNSIQLIKKDNAKLNVLTRKNVQELDTIRYKIKQYKLILNKLQLLYKKRGNGNNGLIKRTQATYKKVRTELLQKNDAEIQNILLNNYTLKFIYINDKKHIDSSLKYNKQIQNIVAATNTQIQDSTNNSKSELLSNIELYSIQINKFLEINNEIGLYGKKGLSNDLLIIEQEIINDIINLKAEIKSTIKAKISRLNNVVIILILFFSIITILIIRYIQKTVVTPLEKIKKYASDLALGKFPDKIKLKNDDEITTVLKYINTLIDGLRNKDKFAKQIGEGNLNVKIEQLSDDDTLSHSLEEMQKSLKDAHLEREKRQEEEQEQKWISSGIAEFATLLRQNNNNLSKLGDAIIQNLVHYVGANQGGIFLYTKNEEEEAYMELIASYAFNRKKFITKKVEIGEGLIGSIALEQKMIHLHKLPANYLEVTSGLGEAKPSDLVIIPLVFNEVFYGALEIAAFEKLEEYKIDFLKTITDNIASTFASVKGNMQTSKLLEQSNFQAEELASQEEEMRQNMEELQATQEEASRRELALQELVDAIDASNYVVEYDASGRITRANRIVEDILQLSSNEIIGKTINDFMDDDLKTKDLWARILNGNIVRNISKITVKGKTSWLNETYSPIKDENGNIVKVIKFASDITEAKELEEEINKESAIIKNQEIILKKELEKLSKKETELNEKKSEITEIRTTIDNVLYHAELDLQMEFKSINQRFLAALDYNQEDLIGKNHDYISSPEEKVMSKDILQELKKNNVFKIKTFKQTKSKQEIHLYLTYTLITDKNKNEKIVIFGHETMGGS